MNFPTKSVLSLTSLLLGSGAVASPTPLVVTPTTAAIVRSASGGMRLADQVVDLVKQEIGELDLHNPKVVNHRRHLEPDELTALLKAWQPILAVEAAKPSAGPPPGGFLHYAVHDKNGSATILARPDGAPTGTRYVALTEAQLSALGAAWPGLAARTPPPVPPTLEHAVKLFLIEAIFGPPGGKRDIPKSLDRLDPGHRRFEFHDIRTAGAVLGVQLTPATKTTLRLAELATELELTQPIAILVNAEHRIWMLGDKSTGKPLRSWRAAEVEVRLDMPKVIKEGAGAHQASIDGASVSYIALRLDKELGG